MSAEITIAIPAYKAEEFLATAVESAMAQSFRDLRILVAVDPADDGTEVAAKALAARDARIEVLCHPERLGWVGNVNACLDRIETPFFAFCFHDDRLEPDFCTRLHPLLAAAPGAVAAAGAIRERGCGGDALQIAAPLAGTPYARARELLIRPPGRYGLKNLIRTEALAGLRLPENRFNGYLADLAFALALALRGDLVTTPEPLYEKALWDGSVTARWHRDGAALPDAVAAATRDQI
ncbi:MAG: glycosyltransferase family A protein, partial [Pseudomonadota bacterium]